MPAVAQQPNNGGVISAVELYSLTQLKQRLGWSKHALREARRAGLPIRRFGTRSYVSGRELISWMETQPTVKG
jgi:hypothetical protein